MLQGPGSFHFSVITQTLRSENWKSFNDYDVYIVNVFRMSHTLQRNLTKQADVQKEKKPLNLKPSYLSYFKEKKS